MRAPAAWLAAVETAGHGIARREALSPADRATEMLMMGLRLSEGVSLARFRAVTGGELEAFVAAPQLAALETAALLTREDGRCAPRSGAGRCWTESWTRSLPEPPPSFWQP